MIQYIQDSHVLYQDQRCREGQHPWVLQLHVWYVVKSPAVRHAAVMGGLGQCAPQLEESAQYKTLGCCRSQ